jgi:hypothetical protein
MSGASANVVSTFTSRGFRYLAGRAATRSTPSTPGCPRGRTGVAQLRCARFDGGNASGKRGITVTDSDIVPDGKSWSGWERNRALAWCRVFFDFPPSFPGATLMNVGYQMCKQGRPPGFGSWALTASRGEHIGMTPDEYYLLQLCLGHIEVDQYPNNHPFRNKRPSGLGEPPQFDLSEWGIWADLVHNGETPLRATRLILDKGETLPRGMLISEGGVVSTEDM